MAAKANFEVDPETRKKVSLLNSSHILAPLTTSIACGPGQKPGHRQRQVLRLRRPFTTVGK